MAMIVWIWLGGEGLLEGLDDGDGPADTGLEADVDVLRLGDPEDFVAMGRQERLVGRHDVLLAAHGLDEKGARRLVAAHQLNDDIDFRVPDDLQGVCRQQGRIDGDGPCRRNVEIGDLL